MIAGTASIEVKSLEILDIRQSKDEVGAREAIIQGLYSTPPRIPEFLLWGDKGLELFDRFTQTASYYPFHSEIEILQEHAAEIVESITPGAAVIELGCGTIRKTQTILSALLAQQKSIHYYALDLSPQTLRDSITALADSFPPSTSEIEQELTITGLLGTYEDCIPFLSNLRKSITSLTFLWLGNSIANFSNPSAASAFLKRLKDACLNTGIISCKFVISTDICEDILRMDECYNLRKPELMAWLRNGFVAANESLGRDVFRGSGQGWKVITEFETDTRNLETYYVALDSEELDCGREKKRSFEKDARIGVITSGKWTEMMMKGVSEGAGLVLENSWKDASKAYCVYLLRA